MFISDIDKRNRYLNCFTWQCKLKFPCLTDNSRFIRRDFIITPKTSNKFPRPRENKTPNTCYYPFVEV